MAAPAELSTKIASLHSRISKERKILEGFQAMRTATTNQDVIRTCESKMRESIRTIGWFEESLRELEERLYHAQNSGTTSTSSLNSSAATASIGSSSAGGTNASSVTNEVGYDHVREGMGRGSPNYYEGGSGRNLPRPPPGAAPSYIQQQQMGRNQSGYTDPHVAGYGTMQNDGGGVAYPTQTAMSNPGRPSRPQGMNANSPSPAPMGAPTMYASSAAANSAMVSNAVGIVGQTGQSGFRSGKGEKVAYTSLDLIKADTSLTSAKISRMLHQLEFKLHVEKQYKEGIDKMSKLYLVDGDKKARADTENKGVESKQKMVLLSQALKKYKTLDVMGDLGDEDDGIPEDVKSNLRKPLSGSLQITIKAARDLAHAPQPKKSKYASESVIFVKVEDTPRARTHPSRNDKWNEDFEILVDKANEVEVTIYDRIPGGPSETPAVPIGMLWLRLSDIVEELRRKRMGAEQGPGWVTAARVNSHQSGKSGSGSAGSGGSGNPGMDVPVLGGATALNVSGSQTSNIAETSQGEGIDAWFAVEPEGAVALHLNFVKSNVRKRPYDAGGLGRQGAVRKRKEEIHEQNGHKFVQKQFYTVVLCALCGEFLLKGAGMTCDDCKYACHKNCYQKVVTKCISKSNADSEKDEEQINHRIPHRFEPITNISPNWCCHCGMVLPLGRKNARKCSECAITAHADCVHLVPDFCGMSMEMANKLLSDLKAINNSRRPGGTAAKKVATPAQVRQQQQQRIAPPSPGPVDSYSGNRTPQGAYDQRVGSDFASDLSKLNVSSPSNRRPQAQVQPLKETNQQQMERQYQQEIHRQGNLAAADGRGYAEPQAPQRIPPSQFQPSGPRPIQPPPRQSSSAVATTFPSNTVARDAYGNSYAEMDAQAQALHQQPKPIQQPLSGQTSLPQQPSPAQPLQSEYSQQKVQVPQAQQITSQVFPSARKPTLPQQLPTSISQNQLQHADPTFPNTSRLAQDPRLLQQQQAPPLLQQKQALVAPQTLRQQIPPSPAAVTRPTQSKQRRIGLDDFNFLAVLGKGNFGKVMLAEEKKSSQLYAIKVLKKEFIIENDEVESTKSEKRVFLAAARERHPFLLGLHSCFQTETRIYFVMEYVSGGDLMLHIQREQFTPRRAKFYAAEVLLALEYFHKNGIVYRDLKLDNILLTLDGHVKVADYGLCKEEMWYGKTTSTFCGTPEFMAPEIILEQRYGRAVDWWAFGVLIYEMLLGQSPFRGEDEDEIFDAILEDEPLYPIHMPRDSVSILQKLLTRDPVRRLGSGEADAEEIKSHLFFKDTNWDDMFHKRVPSPFFPSVASATDTSNFDSEFTSEQPTLTPVHSTLSAQDQGEFAGFSWLAPWVPE